MLVRPVAMPAPIPTEPFRVTAESRDAGQRLDRFLTDAIGTLSRARVKALIEAGQARVFVGVIA